MTRTLYTTAKSANGRKPLALIHHLGLAGEIDVVEVDVYRGEGRAPAYLALNPAGKIPTLVDGDLVLPESNAILAHLGDLGAVAPRRRAEILRWMFWEASEWQPTLTPVMRDAVAHALGLAPPPPPPRWDAAARVLDRLDAHLADGAFVVDELSIADLALAGMMTYARACAPPWARLPHLAAWYARIEALPAWRATAVAPWI